MSKRTELGKLEVQNIGTRVCALVVHDGSHVRQVQLEDKLEIARRCNVHDELVRGLRGLHQIVNVAIRIGDWQVDGRCDPDAVMCGIERLLSDAGEDT